MRNAILGAASAALALSLSSGALFAQEAAAPTVDLCDELVRFIEAHGDAEPALPLALEDARGFQTANDVTACRDGFVRIRDAGVSVPAAVIAEIEAPAEGEAGEADGADIVIQQPAPAVTVEQAAPQVIVDPAQPQVTVQQAQPEIIVNQPAPTVTVDIPQPEIIVRMPEPQVNVAQAAPQVEVVQPPPEVQVVQPAEPQVAVEPAEPQVLVERAADAEADVQVEGAQPVVRYERAEPQVVVNQAEGQPTVRVERMAEAAPAAGAAAHAASVQAIEVDPAEADAAEVAVDAAPEAAAVEEPATTAAVAPAAEQPTRLFPVSELMDREVYNLRGEQIGDIERILRDAQGRLYAVLGHGGFLGLGEKQILVPVADMALAEDRIVLPGLTDDQIRAVPEFDLDEAGTAYTELDDNENADLILYQG